MTAANDSILTILIRLGDRTFALPTEPLAELIPRVDCHAADGAPEYVAGVFNYRGEVTPALDLVQWIAGTPASDGFESRIAVLRVETPVGMRHLGLLVDAAAELRHIPKPQDAGGLAPAQHKPWMGPILRSEDELIQVIYPQRLMDSEKLRKLYQEGDG